jgi:hypothetical protein
MTKEDGIKLREARRARVRRIRARVIAGSVALFLAVWMVITVVLVTGHDPALARKTLTQAATPGTTITTTTTSSGATSSSSGSGSAGVSGVTSSQS